MGKSIKRVLTIAAGVLVAWFVIQFLRTVTYSLWGLYYWEWDFDLWWANEVHQVFDYFMYH